MTVPVRRLLPLLACLGAALGACQTTTTPTEALTPAAPTSGIRSLQSELIEVDSEQLAILAVISTLQDFGFKIDESSSETGLVSGSKKQGEGYFSYIPNDIRVSVTSRKVGDKAVMVRANFQKIIPSPRVQLTSGEPIMDANVYSQFFNGVRQSVFLQRNQI